MVVISTPLTTAWGNDIDQLIFLIYQYRHINVYKLSSEQDEGWGQMRVSSSLVGHYSSEMTPNLTMIV